MLAIGILYLLTAIISGCWELYLMLRPTIGGPWSWWYPITLVASVLLLLGGIVTMVSGARSARFVALASSLVLAGWWIPATILSVRLYFSPTAPTSDPNELLWLLVPVLFVLASAIAGIVLFRQAIAIRKAAG
jgi:hypothetical protein